MQIGEEHLIGAQARALLQLRLLDLDDQLRIAEHLGRIGGDTRPRLAVILVATADAGPRAALHEQGMAGCTQLAHRRRNEADPVLVDLDFPRYADAHEPSSD